MQIWHFLTTNLITVPEKPNVLVLQVHFTLDTRWLIIQRFFGFVLERIHCGQTEAQALLRAAHKA